MTANEAPSKTGAQAISAIVSRNELPRTMPATFRTYRDLRKDPTIAIGRAMAIAPVVAAEWNVQSRPGTPPDRAALVRDTLLPLREDIVQVAMEGSCDFGWQPFELVWDDEGTRVVLAKAKPLLQDITLILVDERTHAFMGFRQKDPKTSEDIDLTSEYAMNVWFRSEGTNWYGSPLLENVRKPCVEWDDCNAGASRYDRKIAGSHWVVRYPIGTSQDGVGGAETDNGVIAAKILSTLESAGSVTIPQSVVAELAGLNAAAPIQQWAIELLSDSSPRQGSFVERLKYIDVLKVRGLLLPERSLQEGQYGTKAEAASHAESAITIRELEHRRVTRIVNTSIVDVLMEQNFGPDAVGSVRLEAAPLASDKRQWLRSLYQAMLSNPLSSVALVDRIDQAALSESVDVPTRFTVSPESIQPMPEVETEGQATLQDAIVKTYAKALEGAEGDDAGE